MGESSSLENFSINLPPPPLTEPPTSLLGEEKGNDITEEPEVMSMLSSVRKFEVKERCELVFEAQYDYFGNLKLGELSFNDGDKLKVINLNFEPGWHLAEVEVEGQSWKGLVPASYLKRIDELSANDTENKLNNSHSRNVSNSSMDSTNTAANPNLNQFNVNTNSQRNSLFHLPINKLGWFLNTGVEDYLSGQAELVESPTVTQPEVESSLEKVHLPETEEVEEERYFIDDGPSWKQDTDLFSVLVHTPETRTEKESKRGYIVYQVTSAFDDQAEVTVERRFSQFTWLFLKLQTKFKPLVLPRLPPKTLTVKFDSAFLEVRRRQLERFMNRLARHPVIRTSHLFTHFLTCASDTEWKEADLKFTQQLKTNPFNLFNHVYHPEFNTDEDGDGELMQKFTNHLKSIEKLLPTACDGLTGFKDSNAEAGKQYRKFSLGLLQLISSTKESGFLDCLNEEDIWCFKDKCEDCHKLTLGLQAMAEQLLNVSDLYQSYSQHDFGFTLELFNEYLPLSTNCQNLTTMHAKAVTKLAALHHQEQEQELEQEQAPEDGDRLSNEAVEVDVERVKGRCETVFNLSLAEVHRIHDEKVRDFHTTSLDFLEQQLEFHTKVIEQLKHARDTLLDPTYSQYSQTKRELPPNYLSEPTLPEQGTERPSSVASFSSVLDGFGNLFRGKTRTEKLKADRPNSAFGEWMGWNR